MSTATKRRLGATEYAELVGRVRDTVAATVPPGSSLLVVSKGDPVLLEQAGMRAGHFPQTADGSFAGHHPHDGVEARDQLEALRRGGAEYLVIPATSRWWLEFYGELAEHLTLHGQLLADVPESCMVYVLGARPEGAPVLPLGEPPEAGPDQVRDFLASLLPESAQLVVLEPAAGFVEALEPLRAIALSIPAEPTVAMFFAELGFRADAGAAYLVVPRGADGWLARHALLEEELESELHKVADQRHLCRVYEINGPREVA
jgi:hypothetical protein